MIVNTSWILVHDASDVLVKKIAIKNSYLEVEDMGGKWVGVVGLIPNQIRYLFYGQPDYLPRPLCC